MPSRLPVLHLHQEVAILVSQPGVNRGHELITGVDQPLERHRLSGHGRKFVFVQLANVQAARRENFGDWPVVTDQIHEKGLEQPAADTR